MDTILFMTGLRTRVLALGLASVLTLATGVSAATSPIAQQANVVATSLRTSVASSAVQDSLNSLGSTSGNAIAAGCAKLVVSCSFGKGTKVVVLYGDSHAVMWASAISAKATFIDTTPWVCSATSNLCPVVLGSQVAYRDAYHLSDPYVVSITNVVSAALAAPLGYK